MSFRVTGDSKFDPTSVEDSNTKNPVKTKGVHSKVSGLKLNVEKIDIVSSGTPRQPTTTKAQEMKETAFNFTTNPDDQDKRCTQLMQKVSENLQEENK